jgi:hypothetical protein
MSGTHATEMPFRAGQKQQEIYFDSAQRRICDKESNILDYTIVEDVPETMFAPPSEKEILQDLGLSPDKSAEYMKMSVPVRDEGVSVKRVYSRALGIHELSV